MNAGCPRAQVVHAQPAVEIDVVEGLSQIAGFALVGIAVQQHDRGVAGLPQKVEQKQRIGLVQIAVPVAEADVELQRLAQPQRLVQPETQQNPILQPGTAAFAPPAGGLGDLRRRRLGQVAVEPASVGQDGLGADRGGRAPVQDLLECRRVVAGRLRGLLGYLLEANDLVSAVAGQRAHFGDVGVVTGAIPVSTSQSLTPAAGRNRRASSLSLNWLRRSQYDLRLNVFRQSQDGAAVGAHGEAEL